jgi:cytochrome c oxidase assembly protein subunit 15
VVAPPRAEVPDRSRAGEAGGPAAPAGPARGNTGADPPTDVPTDPPSEVPAGPALGNTGAEGASIGPASGGERPRDAAPRWRRRISPELYHRITLVALVSLVGIVVTGASVRLTGSGLGCRDWPNCEEGRLVAPLELHPMVEFVNRVVTGLVSIAVIAAVLGALRRTPRRRDLTLLAVGLVVGVLAQVILGAVVVEVGLKPQFVMAHFLVSMALIANAVVLWRRSEPGLDRGAPDAAEPAGAPPSPTERGPGRPGPDGPVTSVGLRRLAGLLVVLTSVVLFLGTVVTATGPHGGDEDAERFDYSLPAVTRLHSGAVWALVAATIVFFAWAGHGRASDAVRHRVEALIAVLFVQGAIGYTQYATDVPPLLVGIHVAGAAATWIAVLSLFLQVRATGRRPATTRPDPEATDTEPGTGRPVEAPA